MEKGIKRRGNLFEIIFMSIAFAVIVMFFVIESVLKSDHAEYGGTYYTYNEGWSYISGPETTEKIDVPGRVDCERNDIVSIVNTLPEDLEEDTYICIHTAKQDVKVYVDGVLRNEYSTADKRLVGHASPTQYVLTKINEEDAGKPIRIDLVTDSSYSGVISTIYIGDSYAIWYKVIKKNIPEFSIGVITAFFGILSILLGLIISIYYRTKSDLTSLGFFMVFLSVWLVCNSDLRQIIFKNVSFANDIAFWMVMFLPTMFCMYMNAVQKWRHNLLYVIAEGLAVVNTVCCVLLQLLDIKDYGDTFLLMVIVIAITMAIIIVTICIDIKRGDIKNYIISAVGIMAALLCTVIEIITYMRRDNEFNLVFIMIGLLILLFVSVVKNLLEVRKSEIERQKAVLTGEARGKFLANMSHEIRTPINAVIGLNEMILRESKEAEVREFSMKIKNASNSLLNIVNDVLDFSKIDSGKMELVEADYNFAELVDTLTTIVSFRAENKNLKLRTNINPDIPSVLYGDSVHLKQIITNILTNAVKYTNEGYIDFSIDATFEEEYVILHVKVSDSGVGIKKEDLDKLFVEFERIDPKANISVEGTGLGMSISRNLLKLMGSSLQVDSVYGVGSTFFFDLKQKIVDDRPISSLENLEKEDDRDSADLEFEAPEARILVVDDNELNLEVFTNLLKRTKAVITPVMSGPDCLFAVEREKYDMIFLDHMMPEMDGIETMKRLLEMEISIPVIALTANAISGARESYIEAGFTDYMTKPVDYNLLENMLKQYLPKDKVIIHRKAEIVATEDRSKLSDIRLEGVDFAYGKLHFNNEKDYLSAMSKLVETIPVELEKINSCIADIEKGDNCLNLRISVHTLKGLSGMVGGFLVQGIARSLEKAAAEEDYDTIKKLAPILVKEATTLKFELMKALVSTEGTEGNQEKKKPDDESKGLLRELKNAASNMDFEAMDSYIDKLSGYDFSSKCDVFGKLKVAVVNLDVEDIISLADELLV